MKVLLLTPTPDKLKPIIEATGDEIVGGCFGPADLAISYNWRHIIKPDVLALRPHINLHISLLPYNRGADPNFWSWFDHTPKGVSIHYMDEHLDTGPVLAQRSMGARVSTVGRTLKTTYDDLQREILSLFRDEWSRLRCLPGADAQLGGGSYHRRADARPILDSLPLGWDTPVALIEEMGAEHHASASFWRKYEEEVANLPKQA